MKKVLIFPAPFHLSNPTADEQNDYMISSLMDEVAMEAVGTFVEVNKLDKAIYAQEVCRLITEQKPDWVIAVGKSATACINLYRQHKILLNPTVTFDDLNNVPEFARKHTYGFFSALPEQERNYEVFQTVYPNVAWYLNIPDLGLIHVKDIAVAIINDK